MDQFHKFVKAPRNLAVCHNRSALVLEAHSGSLPATNPDEAELKAGIYISAIVLRAFATELSLKALHYCLNSEVPSNTHLLSYLFENLGDNESQQRIEHNFQPTAEGREFRTVLDDISRAFIDWRYVYEELGPGADLSMDTEEAIAILGAISSELDDQINHHATA